MRASALEDEIVRFIEEFWGGIGPRSAWRADVLGKLGMDGDDASDFMEAYAARFGVETGSYLWYFHHAEEGLPIVPPFYTRLPTIPITLSDLTRAAEDGEWRMTYPDHVVPKHRYDAWVSLALIAAIPIGIGALQVWAKLTAE